MGKITKSNTKDEILVALTGAIEEQDLLHGEVESLQVIVDDLQKETAKKDSSITSLETLVQEEDVKKKNLIKEFASQSSAIELANKKTEKYVEIKETLKSTLQELELVKGKLLSANEKVKFLTAELESFKNRALPPNKKKGGFFKKLFTAVASTAVVVVVVLAIMSFYCYNEKDTNALTIISYDNGIIAMSYDENILTLQSEDASNLTIGNVDTTIAKWAYEADYDGILFGDIMKADDGRIMLTGSTFEYRTVDINEVAELFIELECYNVLALVNNSENLDLPFKSVSKGDLEFYENRRKIAGILPVFWGKDRRVLHISSDNITGFISSTGIFMEDVNHKEFVLFETVEVEEEDLQTAGVNFDKIKELKETASETASEIADVCLDKIEGCKEKSSKISGVCFDKFKEWKENIKNLW